MKNRDISWRRYKIQETLYIGQWRLGPLQSRHLGTSQSSLNCSTMFLLSALVSGSRSCITDFAMACFMPRSCIKILDRVVLTSAVQVLVLALSVTEPCWLHPVHVQRSQVFGLLQNTWERGSLSTDSWPSSNCLCHAFIWTVLIALSPKVFWIIQIVCIVSKEECSSLTQNLMQIHCSTHSVILNVRTAHYTCSLNGVHQPHWLVQWSRHCSRMSILVLFPWLPGYSNVMQTIFIILTRVGVFPDRPRTYNGKRKEILTHLRHRWTLRTVCQVK